MTIRSRNYHGGGSLLGNIFLLALFGYGVYVAFQYVPQYIESESIDSILDSIKSQHRSHRYQSAQQVEQAIRNNLNMNQMDDMINNISVRESPQGISIEVNYARELDLVFQQRMLNFNKTVDLD